ncbi:MAG: T9SS type A sorting domain-containing protein [Candidatus Zixiibacteriota bacterium]|nr:MAG: T9SS type A sorting domain-containing protein [candidate division Zixibacteria bacterium]
MGARLLTFLFPGLFCICAIVNAQAPDTLWAKLYGGAGNDYGYWLDVTDDGGYIITGSYSLGVGNTDLYLVKTGEDGDTLWTSSYGGDFYDAGRWVYWTPDNGYFVAGIESRFNNTEKNVCVLKTDSLGNILWNYSYGGEQEDGVVTGQPTSDGGYILVGYTASFGLGYMDAWLLKLDADGDTVWTRTFGSGEYDSGRSVIQTPDGGYFVLCNINYGFNDTGLTLIKTDANGDTLWSRRYCQNYATGVSIIPTNDNRFMILANTLAFGDEFDIQMLKIDANGDSLWTRVIGGLDIDMGNSIKQTDDDGFIICGITGPYFDQDIYVVKTDANGDTLWSSTFNGASYGNDLGTCAKPTADGGIILTGSLSTTDVMQEICLIRFESEQVGIEPDIPQAQAIYLSPNYPNPFNASTTIKYGISRPEFVSLKIYDLLGRRVQILVEEYLEEGNHSITFDAADLPSGIYFVKLQAGETVETKRMVLLR